MCVCDGYVMWVHENHSTQHACGSQREDRLEDTVLSFYHWVLGIKLKSTALEASTPTS